MATDTQKCEQKWLKINNRGGVGIKMSWVEKNRKINNRGRGGGGGTIVRDSRETTWNCKLFSQKNHHFRCVTGSEFASAYHKSNVSYEQQKSYIKVFGNGGSYYLAEILLVQSQQEKQ